MENKIQNIKVPLPLPTESPTKKITLVGQLKKVVK
jgi:hypothetical protein